MSHLAALTLLAGTAVPQGAPQDALPARPAPVLAFAGLFTDNLVVQQQRPLDLHGTGAPGSRVTVRFAGDTVRATVAGNGRWTARFAARPADRRQHRIELADRASRVALENVVLGEVWLVAGQSNMSRPANGEQIAAAGFPGIRFFNSSGDTPRRDRLDWPTGWTVCSPEGIAQAGDHWRDPQDPKRVTIRAFSEVGYVFGRTIHRALGVPVGLIQASAGGSKATDWIPVDGIEQQYPYDRLVAKTKHTPGLLFHIRLRPLTSLAVRGVIWYQGEDDGRNLQYKDDLQRLITTWRGLFRDPALPFYMAQIGATSYASGMLSVYEAQQWVMNHVPHTGIAFSNDVYADHVERLQARSAGIGNAAARERHERDLAGQRKRLLRVDPATGWPLHGMSNPHPPNKELIATRLGRIALHETYGRRDGPVYGPMYRSSKVAGDRIVVTFAHAGSGLRSADGGPLNWFEIAGDESRDGPQDRRRGRSYGKAQARITGPDTVEVWSEDVAKPVHVRFGWHMYARNNLVNSAGLPGFPFRTDTTGDPRKR